MNINLKKEIEEDYKKEMTRYKTKRIFKKKGFKYKRDFKNNYKRIQLAVLGKG